MTDIHSYDELLSSLAINPDFLLPDDLWEKIKPLLPIIPKKKPGRPRMDDRKALDAIFYFLRTGIHWKALPPQLGASSTVHDRFSFLCEHDFFFILWREGLVEYDYFKGIDWKWQSMDGAHIMAPLATEDAGPSYKHGAKSSTTRSLLVDGAGMPLSIFIAPANKLDFQLAEQTLLAITLPRPDPLVLEQHLCLDKGYDCADIDNLLSLYNYISHIRRKGVDYSTLAPKFRARRWVVERTHSWINNFRRLVIRREKKSRNYLALLYFACAIICFRQAHK